MKASTITTSLITSTAAIALLLTGCGKSGGDGAKKAETLTIQNIGSDTMVNLAQEWAEAYAKVEPSVSVEVSGGGSGVGVAALLNGTCDIANSSRKLEAEEEEKATAKYNGQHPKEWHVGYDALAIYVHPSNPMTEISVEELGNIFREGGTVVKWSDLGATLPSGDAEIIRVSRQNNSGTYHYFREAVVGKKADFKAGSRDMNGSKDVVDLISSTPTAIGYSGIGYKTDKVKVLKVSKKKGDASVEPTIATTLDKTYPIARPMFMYTPPGVGAHVVKYLEWTLGPKGQEIVEHSGYIPLVKK